MKKKRKTKAKKKPPFQLTEDYLDFHLFKNPWCPLFGDLPYESNFPQITHHLSLIIYDARKVWGVNSDIDVEYNLDKYHKHDNSLRVSCPDPEEVPSYPKDKLLLAREFYKWWDMKIWPFVEIYKNKYSCETYDLPTKEILECVYKYSQIKHIESPEMFSLIAINEAWESLKKILVYGESENKPNIKKQIKDTESLLNRAYYELLPDAELGKKRRKQMQTFGKSSHEARRRKLELEKKQWLKEALELRNKYSNKTRRNIAYLIHKKVKPSQSLQTVYKYLLKKLP